MKRILLLLALINAMITVYAQTPGANGIIYVKKGSAGTGTSWANAYPELAGALNAAATLNDGTPGTVKQIWVASGTYYPSFSIDGSTTDARLRTFKLVKDVAIYGGFAGTEATVQDRVLTANETILSGDYNTNGVATDNVYHVVSALGNLGTVSLNGFSIIGGYADGVFNVNVNGIDVSCENGGGIYIYTNDVFPLTNLLVTDNYAGNNGGGIFSTTSYNLSKSVIRNNTGINGGGGVFTETGEVNYELVNIYSNVSNGFGGGANFNITNFSSFRNVIFKGNTAVAGGGGLAVMKGVVYITNAQVTGNTTNGNGGGIYIADEAADSSYLVNMTISANRAETRGGGIYGLRGFTLFNSIIYGNAATTDNGIAEGDPNRYYANYNLIQGQSPAREPFNSIDGNINPQFKNMPAPGLTTGGDFSLLSTSPVVNRGLNYMYGNVDGNTLDLAGNLRIFGWDKGGLIDMGAYELQERGILPTPEGVLFVKKGSTGAGTSWSDAMGEVGDALYNVPASVKQIWVAAGTYYPLHAADDLSTDPRQKAFVMPIGMKMYGGFAGFESNLLEREPGHTSILSGDLGVIGTETDNAYHVVVGANTSSFELDGFTISDGYSLDHTAGDYIDINTNRVYSAHGAGIYLVNCVTPKLSNLIITNNKASGNGGGIYQDKSEIVLTKSTVSGNEAVQGGGMFVSNQGTARLDFSKIAGNSAVDGAGLYAGTGTAYALVSSIVSGNVASGNGGGMYSAPTNANLINSTIAANSAGGNGGAVYATATYNITNTIVFGNNTGVAGTGPNTRYSMVQGQAADETAHNLSGFKNPRFKELPAAGLTTAGNFRLNIGSPAINMGNTTLYGYIYGAKDMVDSPRLFGPEIDLGAYELQKISPRPDENGILYVKKGGTGDGSSWANALADLAPAIADANTMNTDSAGTVKSIWVTADKYYPMDGMPGTGSDAAFVPAKDVALYGGFLGTETTLEERDLNNNLTVLSGDIGVTGNTTDNAYHVLISSGDQGTATLDGFIINSGNASTVSTSTVNGNDINNSKGGGLYVVNSNVTLSHLYVNLNIANSGGGIYVTGTSVLSLNTGGVSSNAGVGGHGGGALIEEGAEARFTNAIFYTNTGGAVLTKTGGLLVLDNSDVRGNSSTSSEPGISGYAKLTNVQLTGNSHTGGNGPVLDLAAGSSVINCTVSGNATGNITGAAVWPKGMITMSNTVVYGNSNKAVSDITQITGANNFLDGNVDPGFINMPSHTTAPFVGGTFSLKTTSPLIDAGDNSLYPGLDANSRDLGGNARVTYFGSGGIIDIGAFEFPVQVIRGNDMTKTYGDPDFDPGFTASSGLPVSFVSDDENIATVVNGLIHIRKAGVVNIIATQNGDVGNSPAPSRTFILTINKAMLTATANDTSVVYTGIGFSGGNDVVITGYVLNETISVVDGTLTYDSTSQGAINVGDYFILPGGLTAENYAFNYVSGNLHITGAPLTITAVNDSVFYNGNAYSGGNDVTYDGFVNGETSSVLMGTLIYTGSSQGAVQSGSYVIEPGGLTAPNYTITFEDGELVIMKDTLKVTATGFTRDYDATAYSGGNGVTYDGFVNNETVAVLNGTLAYTGNAQGAINAGTYAITPEGLTADNYIIEFVDGELLINQLPLTVAGNNFERCFGEENPVFDFTYAGFLPGESFTIAPVGSSSAGTTTASGNYDITFAGGIADNYSITYTNGVLTITPVVDLTLSADGVYLCGTDAPLLTVDGGTDYTWLRDGVEVNRGIDVTMRATAAGVYSVTMVNGNGCTSKSNDVTITAVVAPVLSFEVNSACLGTPVTVASNSSDSEVDYVWSVAGQTSNEAAPSFTITTPGDYVVIGNAYSKICPSLVGSLEKAITISAPAPGQQLPIVQAITEERIQLNARELNGATYKWTPATGLSGDDVVNPTTVLTENQTYHIKMSFANGCVTTDTLQVTVSHKPNFEVANAFSPNGDGKNDLLHYAPRDLKAVTYFKVYDKTGNLMFQTTDAAKGWDGTVNGKPMRTDTYIWMAVGVDMTGKIVKRQGTITLIR